MKYNHTSFGHFGVSFSEVSANVECV